MKALTKDDLATEADLSEDADLIVNRAAHFVGDWIEEHVVEQPTLVPAGVDAAQELASQCIADAKGQGIAAEDIQEEVVVPLGNTSPRQSMRKVDHWGRQRSRLWCRLGDSNT